MPREGFRKNPQCINRKGRPKKGLTLTDILKKELNERVVSLKDADGVVVSAKEAVVRKIIDLALSGDYHALKYIFDRVDGFPTARVEQEMAFPRKIELVTQYEAERIDADTGTDSPKD